MLGSGKDRWLDTAVSGIRFGPDRRQVRRELAAHLEDKEAGLRRSFPDIPEAEAQERALSAMGDAEALKQELAKIHRPWLAWLWTVSRWTLAALWIMFLLVGMGNRDGGVEHSIWGRMSGRAMYHRIWDGEKAKLGGYTFRIIGVAYVDRPQEYGAEDSLQLTLRVSSPRFWARIDEDTVLTGLTAVDPRGGRHEMDRCIVVGRTDTEHNSSYWLTSTWDTRILSGGDFCRWGLGWKDFSLYVPAEDWTPGERMTLEFTCELGDFVLSAPVTERVVVP